MTDDSSTLILSSIREFRNDLRLLTASVRQLNTNMLKLRSSVNLKTAAHIRQSHNIMLKVLRSQSTLASKLLEQSEDYADAQRRDHMYNRPERRKN